MGGQRPGGGNFGGGQKPDDSDFGGGQRPDDTNNISGGSRL